MRQKMYDRKTRNLTVRLSCFRRRGFMQFRRPWIRREIQNLSGAPPCHVVGRSWSSAASRRSPTGSLTAGMRAHARHDGTERGRWSLRRSLSPSPLTGLLLIETVRIAGGPGGVTRASPGVSMTISQCPRHDRLTDHARAARRINSADNSTTYVLPPRTILPHAHSAPVLLALI